MDNSYNALKILSFYQDAQKIIKGEKIIPRLISIWPSTFCDLKCQYCYCRSIHKNGSLIDTKKLLDFIDDIANKGIEAIEFTGGGEPTLHEDLFDIINYIYKKGLKVGLQTNTYKIDYDKINCLSYIRISLDTVSEDKYIEMKNAPNGRFNAVLDSIKKILSIRDNNETRVGLKFAINLKNYNDIEKMAELSLSLGVDYCQFKPTHNDINGLSGNLLIETENRLQKLRSKYNNSFVAGGLIPHGVNSNCFMSPIWAVLQPTGNVYMCCYLLDYSLIGNVFDNGFDNIWFNDRHRYLLNNIPNHRCSSYDCRWHYYNSEMKQIIENNKYELSFI